MNKLTRIQDQHAVRRMAARAAGASVYLTSLYSLPDAEMPMGTFLDYAMNAFGGGYGGTGNAVVFTAIDRRMSVFTEATFKWRNLDDKKLWGNTDLQKLETPWPGGTAADLLARMELDASLAGTAFVRDTGDGAERLRPDWCTLVSRIVRDGLGEQVRRLVGVAFTPEGDTEREDAFYPINEVAIWAPIPDPLLNFRGLSWLTPVVKEVLGDLKMAAFRDAYFENAASPNLVIKYSQKLAPGRVERLQTMMKARHGGPDNAFGTLVLDEGADLTVVGSNMEGSAFNALQAAGETRILMASGVPPIVAGARQGLEASQIGEYRDALRAFADLKMRPNWRGACAALQKLVNVPAGAQLWFDTSDVSALQQGEGDKASTSSTQAQTIAMLCMQGFDPDSAVAAVIAGDMSLLKHTGAMSVQVQPGTGNAGGAVTPPAVPGRSTPALTARAVHHGHGNREELHRYWTKDPEGLAKWAKSPKPWTRLHEHLAEFITDPDELDRTTSAWFQDVFGFSAGSDKNRVAHGHPPRGHRVGPG